METTELAVLLRSPFTDAGAEPASVPPIGAPVANGDSTPPVESSHAANAAMVGERGGKVVDDAWITTKAKAALLGAANLKSGDIKVETLHGTVTLTGSVPSATQSEQATLLVRGLEGVSSVDNRLIVKL